MRRNFFKALASVILPLLVLSCLASPAPMPADPTVTSTPVPAADVLGDWFGTIDVGSQSIRISIRFSRFGQGLAGTIDIAQQGARGLSLSGIDYRPPRLLFDLPSGQGTAHFDGVADQHRISGAFTQGPARGTFVLERSAALPEAAQPAPAFSEGTPISLATATGTIEGTLDLPSGRGPFPVALIISGSGPTDRNGNSPLLKGRNDSLEMLARGLREAGFASVRYDKRGVGGSAAALTDESDLTLSTYIDDAVAWIRLLKRDHRFTRIAVIGHSEGSLIGMEAARIGAADACVSLEGAGRPAGEILKDQLASQPAALRDAAYSIIDSLDRGTPVADVPKDLLPLFRPSVQPYMISWFRYDPRKSIASLKIPVLVVQGTTDLQVSMRDAENLHDAFPGSKLVVIQGMNHVLKTAPPDPRQNMAAYSNPDLPLAPSLVDSITAFLQKALG